MRFGVRPWQDSDEDAVVVECPVHDRRTVRSSSGHTEERIVVLMDVMLLGRTMTAEITLTNRDEMGFRMLIGREALRNGFLVAAGESFLGGARPAACAASTAAATRAARLAAPARGIHADESALEPDVGTPQSLARRRSRA